MNAAINNLSKQSPLLLAAGAALLLYVVYGLLRKTITDTAAAAGGILSGNNAATRGTDYEGKGAAGTVGAVTNAVLGGLPASAGSWIAGLLASDSAGEDRYYTARFPDGSRHAVPSTAVARSGAFTVGTDATWPAGTRPYAGKRYILGMQGLERVARAA
jgi:hypothetical protein